MLLAIYHLHDRERLRARRESVTRSVVIGSSRDCDIVIEDDARVVAHHLRLAVDPPAIEPLEGVVLVDGRAIDGPTLVRLGAPIQIGDTIVKLRPSPAVPALSSLAELDRTNPPNRRIYPRPAPNPSPAEAPRQTVQTPPLGSRGLDPRRHGSTSPPPIWRKQLANDPTEQRFLAALRERPAETETRMAYADWLDACGRTIEAVFVRTELRPDDPAIVRVSELDWRAITSCAPIEDCRVGEGDPDGPQCPARWDGLTATRDERLRRCDVCKQQVRFCATIGDAALAGRVEERVVFDTALDDIDAYAAYHNRPLELVNTIDEPVSLPSIDTPPSLDDSDDPAFFTLDDESPQNRE
ncbi:MAG: TIGR02996 domain-containing protein [Kofleriaceae bacterium]